MFTSVQVISIVAAILGGFAWLIAFLTKRLDHLENKFMTLDNKLTDKVSEALCQERRSRFPCCNSDGTFNQCPLPPDPLQTQLLSVLKDIQDQLKDK
jgi:hypothetical protein